MSEQSRLLLSRRRLARGVGGAATTQRVAQVAVASAVALVMSLIMLLAPLDWALWKVEGRLGNQQPSGRIGYLQVEPEVSAPGYPEKRVDLARTLDNLRARGVERVFLNLPLAASRETAADARLAEAMRAWGQRLTIVDNIVQDENGLRVQRRVAPHFNHDHPRVYQETSRNWPGFTWELPYSFRTPHGRLPEFGATLAGMGDGRPGRYRLDIGFRHHDDFNVSAGAPRVAAGSPESQPGLPPIIVIGTTRTTGSSEYSVPGQPGADASFVAIYGAETLMRKPIAMVPGWIVVGLFALFLSAAALIENPPRRRVAYFAPFAMLAYFVAISAGGSVRFELSYAMALLPLFAVLRTWSKWQHRLGTIDPDTGLPTLRACLEDLSARKVAGGFVAVARIHGYETLMRSLGREQRSMYVMKLVERLRITDPDLQVFVDGHYLSWIVEDMDQIALRGHFEGLRAIFAAPVPLDEQSVDVGITFGAADIAEADPEYALGAALEAVEQTDEALEPIRFAANAVQDDALWDLSLRSRIDTAMEAGEVFCVYQPKVDIISGRIIGVEALVRWQDPERGYISPIHFVMQCEKAGRMEYLTRYVLQSACSAGRLLTFRGHDLTMAVNISATLLTDMRIVGIVRNVLQATDFDPARLVLEITETARIRDFAQARTVLSALRSLGARIAMDDFGVGAANFEAFQALPVDEIKIDRQFVAAARRDPKARAITASLLQLGIDSRISVVAEGAETDEDVQLLREIGCRQVQGYALARPIPLTNILTSLGNPESSRVNG